MVMLATELKTIADLDRNRTFILQQKLDGARYTLQLFKDGRVELKGRHSNALMNEAYPEIIQEAQEMNRGLAEDILLDGEMVVGERTGFWFRCDFSLLASREHTKSARKINLLRRMKPVRLIVFDILTESTKALTLKERTIALETFLGQFQKHEDNPYFSSRRIQAIPSQEGDYLLAEELFREAKRLSMEGLVLKDPQSHYEDKRSNSWLKLKSYTEEDVKVLGYTSKNREISSLITDKGKVNFVGQPEEVEQAILHTEIMLTKENTIEKQYYFNDAVKMIAKVKYLPSEYANMRFPILKEVMLTKGGNANGGNAN